MTARRILAGSSYGHEPDAATTATDNSGQQQGQQNQDNKKRRTIRKAARSCKSNANPPSNPPTILPSAINRAATSRPPSSVAHRPQIPRRQRQRTLGFKRSGPNGQVQRAMLTRRLLRVTPAKAASLSDHHNARRLAQFCKTAASIPTRPAET